MRTPSSSLLALVVALSATALIGCGGDAPQATIDPVTADLLAAGQAGAVADRPGGGGETILLDTLGYDLGDPAAPVQLIEFSDFGCGYCRGFHLDVWPTIEREYVATGKVFWKYVPMVIGRFSNATEAAMAGECAGAQGQFHPMQTLLFAEQESWKDTRDPLPVLEALAERSGVEVAGWRECMDTGERRGRIDGGTQLSRQAGVRGTPTFYILGYAPLPGALPLELFREVLDTAYAQTVRELAAGAP